jgi:DNA polymerase III delta subunit
MSVITYHKLAQTLDQTDAGQLPSLFLVCGEPYLVKQAFSRLSVILLGKDRDAFCIDTIDGDTTPLGDIIEQVATFSFPSKKKIIAARNMPLFQTGQASAGICYTEADLARLETFIQDGWPDDHLFVITCDSSDKRKKIYKTISESGLIIDCTVPKGARKADLNEQRKVLTHICDQVLNKVKKKIDPKALEILIDRTGFNLDGLTRNLEKLSAYVSDRPIIQATDVKAVVIRDKKDPIFNLTNAVMDKDVKAALFYWHSLIHDGFHPLQLLKALENVFRKLILIKDFLNHQSPEDTHISRMSFNQFKQRILPQAIAHDTRQFESAQQTCLFLTKKKLKKKEFPADLFLAPNPNNAYPVYQVFKRSERFCLDELYHTLIFLSDLDYSLKTSAIDVSTQIESYLIRLCSRGGFFYAQKNKDYRHHF